MGKAQDDFVELVKEFQSVADFLTIYIEEAHPTDEWAFHNNYDIKQHKTLQERMVAANIVAEKIAPCQVYLDPMNNENNLAYGALPERLYIIVDGVIKFAGIKGPPGYKPLQVRAWLSKYTKQKKLK